MVIKETLTNKKNNAVSPSFYWFVYFQLNRYRLQMNFMFVRRPNLYVINLIVKAFQQFGIVCPALDSLQNTCWGEKGIE